MTRVLIKNVNLNVEIYGNGPPLIALHGFTGNTTTWESFIEASKQEFKIIAIDFLGHGLSDSPADATSYSHFETIQLFEILLDQLQIQKAFWLGYSMGGRVALYAATALEQRTSGLIIESGSAGLPDQKSRLQRVTADENLANWLEMVPIEQFVDHWESIPLWSSQRRLSEPKRRALREQRLSNNPLGLANSLRGAGTGAQQCLHNQLSNLKIPCLFLAGEDDTKFVELAREMKDSIPGAQLTIIPKAGHTIHMEQPKLFNSSVLSFLRTHAKL